MRIFQPTVTGSNTTTGSLHISGPVYFYTLETSSVFHILTYNTSSGQVFYTASEAIGRRPGEPDQSIQFNDGGEFSGSANFTFNNDIVYLTGSMFVSGAISASFGENTVGFYGTASWAQSASISLLALTASFVTASNVWGIFGSSSVDSASFASSSISASYAETASLAYTASFITASNVWGIFGSSSVDSASFASSSISASYAETASAAPLDTYIQYNKEGLLGAEQYFRYIYASHSLQQGNNVVASGEYSHAEGSSSIAFGDYSHVEGRGNYAAGEGSHVEGRNNYASASWSHVGGLQNTSSGIYQTVVGQNSVQLTSQSAFIVGGGRATNDRSNALVVIPKTTTGLFQSDSILKILVDSASISASYLYLNNLPTSPELNVLVYNSESNQVFYTSSTSVGGGGGGGTPAPSDTYIQYNSASAFGANVDFRYIYASKSLIQGDATAGIPGSPRQIGYGSANFGESGYTAIYGAFSASMVSGNIALSAADGNRTADFPSGYVFYGGQLYDTAGVLSNTNYFKIDSIAWDGNNTIISSSTNNALSSYDPLNPSFFFLGFAIDVDSADPTYWNGNISTSDGVNFNFGYCALAAGSYSIALGYSSHAEGNNTRTLGGYSHAEGDQTTAAGQASHAEGIATKAISIGSHAEGFNAIASGFYSHAEGDTGYAIGFASHAEGSGTFAIGDGSHTEGASTVAAGNGSHAEGSANSASGDFSHAEGENTHAFGYGSHAEGYLTYASGNYSNTKGIGTTASGDYQLVVGSWNVANVSQSAFIIGDGFNENNRHNVLFVSKSHFEVSASSVFLQGLPTSSELNVLVYNSSSGQVYYTASNAIGGGGAAGNPAPPTNSIQFNNDGVFGGSEIFTFISSSSEVYLTGSFTTSGSSIITGSTSVLGTSSIDGIAFIGTSSAYALYTTARITTISSSINTIYSLQTASYDGAFFDYTLISASNARAGQIMSIWSGSQIRYTETTTTDIGSTSEFIFSVALTAGSASLQVTGSADAIIKTIIKGI